MAAAGALAACGGGGSSAASSAAPETAGSTPPKGTLALTSQVPVEGGYVNQDVAVVVTQPSEGQYAAFTAVCPHQGCLVSEVQSNEIACPCHGSLFSAVDGSVIQGPAVQGLAAAKVAVQGDRIVLA